MPEYAQRMFPKRTENTHWWNNEPITDLQEALYFLLQECSSIDPHHLQPSGLPNIAWELVYEWAREKHGYCDSGRHYHQINPALAERMVSEKFVEPRRIDYWGGSRVDSKCLVISQKGKESARGFENEMLGKARSLLIPGVHTDLSGEPKGGWLKREQWGYGRLYVEFQGPDEVSYHVYPETGEIKKAC